MCLVAPRVLYKCVYHKPTSLFLSSQAVSSEGTMFAELALTFVFKVIAPRDLEESLASRTASEVPSGLWGCVGGPIRVPPAPPALVPIVCCAQP